MRQRVPFPRTSSHGYAHHIVFLPCPGPGVKDWIPGSSHVHRRDALYRIVSSAAYRNPGIENDCVDAIWLTFEDGTSLCVEPKQLVKKIPIPSEAEMIKHLENVSWDQNKERWKHAPKGKLSLMDMSDQDREAYKQKYEREVGGGVWTAEEALYERVKCELKRPKDEEHMLSMYLHEDGEDPLISADLPNPIDRLLSQPLTGRVVFGNDHGGDKQGGEKNGMVDKGKGHGGAMGKVAKVQTLRCFVLLGAVRDMTTPEVRRSEHLFNSWGVPIVRVNVGRQAEFTSKVVDSVVGHHAFGLLGPNLLRLRRDTLSLAAQIGDHHPYESGSSTRGGAGGKSSVSSVVVGKAKGVGTKDGIIADKGGVLSTKGGSKDHGRTRSKSDCERSYPSKDAPYLLDGAFDFFGPRKVNLNFTLPPTLALNQKRPIRSFPPDCSRRAWGTREAKTNHGRGKSSPSSFTFWSCACDRTVALDRL